MEATRENIMRNGTLVNGANKNNIGVFWAIMAGLTVLSITAFAAHQISRVTRKLDIFNIWHS